MTKGEWTPTHKKINIATLASTHLQVTIGLLLYVGLSPVTQTAFKDFGAAMKAPVLRFWAVEHIFMMILAAVFATVGNIKSKKADGDAKKHKMALIFFGISFVLLLAGIPWPFREALGRTWLALPF